MTVVHLILQKQGMSFTRSWNNIIDPKIKHGKLASVFLCTHNYSPSQGIIFFMFVYSLVFIIPDIFYV